MCVPGRTVEVKLLRNFFKIPKICNIIPNKGRYQIVYLKRGLTNAIRSLIHIIHRFPFHLSPWHIQNWFKKLPQCIWTRIVFDGKLQQHVTRISERIHFTPNKTDEVSLQKWKSSFFGTPSLKSDFLDPRWHAHVFLVLTTMSGTLCSFIELVRCVFFLIWHAAGISPLHIFVFSKAWSYSWFCFSFCHIWCLFCGYSTALELHYRHVFKHFQ